MNTGDSDIVQLVRRVSTRTPTGEADGTSGVPGLGSAGVTPWPDENRLPTADSEALRPAGRNAATRVPTAFRTQHRQNPVTTGRNRDFRRSDAYELRNSGLTGHGSSQIDGIKSRSNYHQKITGRFAGFV